MKRRREFLALLAKGALGVGVLGVMGCDSGGGGQAPVHPGLDTQPKDTLDTAGVDWVTGGVDMGPELPNLEDTVEDARLGGLPDLPDTPETWDLSGIDTGPTEPDLKDAIEGHDWTGPAGVPPMPDTIDGEE